MVTRIEDPQDARILDYVGLTDMVLRTRVEPERGLYLAESEKVIRRALRAGHHPRSYLMGERWLTDLADLVEDAERSGVPVYVADAPVIEEMTGFHLHRGALASMHRPELPSPRGAARRRPPGRGPRGHRRPHQRRRDLPQLRAALGVDAVLVTPRCADPLYRRSVRVSMGTVFQVPWTRIDPWPGGLEVLRDNGFRVAAFALTDDAVSLDDLAAEPPERLAVVFGAEGHGLSRRTIEGADLVVQIPMAGGVDSLNVAAASAVALWALRPPQR